MAKKSTHKSALQELKGIRQPDSISQKITQSKIKNIDINTFTNNIRKGNISFLSRAITLIESKKESDKKNVNTLIQSCLPYANNSVRIGITGVPGVGKSTFIDAFGTYLTGLGKKVAVLAIDPSSSINKGSILGDKTRMEKLSKDKNAFIRPTPAGDSLGGIARKTKETIVLCEAAGFDIILIETVGVGQSETLVRNMVDFFLLLKLAGSGDELQGIKRGIMEMADVIAINKADGDNIENAKIAKTEFTRALHLYRQKDNQWIPKVMTCSALNNSGIEEIWNIIEDFLQLTKGNSHFEKNRIEQNKNWLLQNINEQLQYDFYHDKNVSKELDKQIKNIEDQNITPFEASQKLIEFYKKKI
ncbi:MAG: methylmalonyl Co-A mutase-associated GTPase MeaB [Bacteroidota bacterium]